MEYLAQKILADPWVSRIGISLGAMALVSLLIILWQHTEARMFDWKLSNHRTGAKNEGVEVAVIKPLNGKTASTERCLESWLQQSHGVPLTMVCVAGADSDPVCSVVRALQDRHGRHAVQMGIVSSSSCGNPKILKAAAVEPGIHQPIVILSDADVEAPPELIGEIVTLLGSEQAGLVHCFYTHANPINVPMKLEAIGMNCDYWCQVLQSTRLTRIHYAMGAVMAFKRSTLESIGGFSAVREFLADDYRLGNLVARERGRILLAGIPVKCWSEPSGWAGMLRHQLRWARTIRHCEPLSWAASISGNALLWPVLWAAWSPSVVSLTFLAIALLVRIATAAWQWKRFTRSKLPWGDLWMVPLRDACQVCIWIASWLGRRVEWGGQTLQLGRGGRIVAMQPSKSKRTGKRRL